MAEFKLSELSLPECFKLLTATIVPRPIAFVSSLSGGGHGNLAPFSYFMLGGTNPPSCVICPINNREGAPKDTLRNIEETGEYAISLITGEMVEHANQTAYPYQRGDDEFDHTPFTRAQSRLIKPPFVAESPLSMELKCFQVVRHGEGALASSYIIGEILMLHAADSILTDGVPDNTKFSPMARMGGEYYLNVLPENLRAIPRPTEP